VAFRDANAAKFEVVFVSSDHSEKEKQAYMTEAKMKWPSVPYGSKSAAALKAKYQVRGIPTLVVLSPQGTTISATARNDVANSPSTALAGWSKAAAAKP
jgi:thioredoxin-related protein